MSLIIIVVLIVCGKKDKPESVEAPNVGIHRAILMGDNEALQLHINADTDVNEN